MGIPPSSSRETLFNILPASEKMSASLAGRSIFKATVGTKQGPEFRNPPNYLVRSKWDLVRDLRGVVTLSEVMCSRNVAKYFSLWTPNKAAAGDW